VFQGALDNSVHARNGTRVAEQWLAYHAAHTAGTRHPERITRHRSTNGRSKDGRLPALLRWARLPADHSESAEQQLAERTATQAALAALPGVASRINASDEAVERLRADLEQRLADITDEAAEQASEASGGSPRDDYRRLHAAILADKRAALIRLRDAHVIDDIVLRRVQARLDAEEVRLSTSLEAESE
jgi:CPA1 family monovalent cation:H+ antiporter